MSTRTDDIARSTPRHLGPVLAMLLATTAIAWHPAFGQEKPDVARKLDLNKQQLEEAQKREKAIQGDLAQLAQERERLNARLLETAGLIQRSEAQMTAIEARLGELEAQEKLIRGSLEKRHDSIAKLLSALQRMGRNPPPVVVTRREDALQMVRSAMLLAAAFPELRTQALELAGRLNELTRIMGDIRSEGDRLRSETDKLNESRLRLAGLMEAKKQSAAERQAELNEVRKAAADIAKNVSDLTELISRLDKVVAERTGLGDYERDTEKAKAVEPAETTKVAMAPPALPKPESKSGDSKVAVVTPPKISPPVVELAPSGSIGLGAAGRLKPAIPFHLAKAQLPLPSQGNRVRSFGEKTQYGGRSEGIFIETRFSGQVTAPCDGWVVYAGPFRTYGQVLIINAGGGYHVLLAGLSQIDVQLGQFVLAAEPVGTMSPAPKTQAGKANQSSPVLYVEFRKDGRPIDPDPWWVGGHQKVQG